MSTTKPSTLVQVCTAKQAAHLLGLTVAPFKSWGTRRLGPNPILTKSGPAYKLKDIEQIVRVLEETFARGWSPETELDEEDPRGIRMTLVWSPEDHEPKNPNLH